MTRGLGRAFRSGDLDLLEQRGQLAEGGDRYAGQANGVVVKVQPDAMKSGVLGEEAGEGVRDVGMFEALRIRLRVLRDWDGEQVEGHRPGSGAARGVGGTMRT